MLPVVFGIGQKGDAIIGVNIFCVNVIEIITDWMDWLKRLNTPMMDVSFTCLPALLANNFKHYSSLIH